MRIVAGSIVLSLLSLGFANHAFSQEPIADWTFVPEYELPGRAGNHPGPRVRLPRGEHPLIELDTAAIRFVGESPTQRLNNLLPAESIPKESFSIETWILHHVNQPVGVLVSAKDKRTGGNVPWSLGFHNWKSSFTMQGQDGELLQLQSRMKKWSGYKQRWVHQVVSYDGHDVKVFVNGDEVARGHLHHDDLAWPEKVEFELSAYMKNEPFMQWSNLVHRLRLYSEPLTETKIQDNFNHLKRLVEQGKRYADLFHFTAGPYLNYAKTDQMNLVWETDRDSMATIQWGTDAQLQNEQVLTNASRLHCVTLENLQPNTPYFYRIRCQAGDAKIDSGVLTFKTAVAPGEPFRFAVIGDTESRPHVNDQLCKKIWEERPNFVINLGDLTDGGKELHRYEWTHEYFVGMTQLTSRVPFFNVPGNGEGDLYWYNHYHMYPEPENYYRFDFGDATFFMLDSNQRQTEFEPGGKQYQWLKKELQNCDATWKFACHHHASYTGEEDDYGNTWEGTTTFGDPAVQKIVPLYEEFGIDMVMFGHLHLYERSHPIKNRKVNFEAGTIHLLAGGGGGNLEDFAPTPAFFSAKNHRGHHYVLIELANQQLKLHMFDTNGSIRDSLLVQKHRNQQLKTSRISGDTQTRTENRTR